jgi:phosphatidylglycerol:prolipoprotein diacylglycerol transferase
MHPELFSIGFLHLKTYGCFMAIGFIASWQVLAYLCRRSGRPFDPLGNLVVALMVSGVLGSRIAYVIEHWRSEFAAKPLDVIRIDQGGLMFYGGFLLAAAVFFAWCFTKRQKPLALAELLATVVPLGHAFGRIGCFFYGCCHGRISSSPLAVSFPRGSPAWYEQLNSARIASSAAESLPVLPVQLFEAAANLGLFGVLFWVYVKRGRGTLSLYLIGYALIRFGLECLRGDPRAEVGPFSISQTISIGLLAAGAALLAWELTRKAVPAPRADAGR